MSIIGTLIPLGGTAILAGLGWLAAMQSRRQVAAHKAALTKLDEQPAAATVQPDILHEQPKEANPFHPMDVSALARAIKSAREAQENVFKSTKAATTRYNIIVAGHRKPMNVAASGDIWLYVPNKEIGQGVAGDDITGSYTDPFSPLPGAFVPRRDPTK